MQIRRHNQRNSHFAKPKITSLSPAPVPHQEKQQHSQASILAHQHRPSQSVSAEMRVKMSHEISNTEVRATTPPGSGSDHSLIINIGGQTNDADNALSSPIIHQ